MSSPRHRQPQGRWWRQHWPSKPAAHSDRRSPRGSAETGAVLPSWQAAPDPAPTTGFALRGRATGAADIRAHEARRHAVDPHPRSELAHAGPVRPSHRRSVPQTHLLPGDVQAPHRCHPFAENIGPSLLSTLSTSCQTMASPPLRRPPKLVRCSSGSPVAGSRGSSQHSGRRFLRCLLRTRAGLPGQRGRTRDPSSVPESASGPGNLP
jgi:hypothetical protein